MSAIIFPSFKHAHDIADPPKLVGHASRHRRSDAKRFVDADEIVVGREQRDRVRMVLKFLAECICQSREAPHVHSHVQILALGK